MAVARARRDRGPSRRCSRTANGTLAQHEALEREFADAFVTAFPMGHMNVITSWAVNSKGEVKHVYA